MEGRRRRQQRGVVDLYVARHGAAGRARDDASRELTAAGVGATRAVYTRCAVRIHQPIATLVCSPLTRARQTAEIALDTLPIDPGPVVVSEALCPDSTPAALAQFLDLCLQWPVMLVGHQPLLGDFLSWLTDQEHFRNGVATSSLVALNLIAPARGCGTVLWQA